MDPILLISIAASLVTLIYSAFLVVRILRLPAGDEKVQEIAKAIAEGAAAYLARQNKTVAVVAIVLTAVLWATLGVYAAGGFLIGALASVLAGYSGMMVAVRSNSRTTEAAKKGLPEALYVAFQGGSVTGLIVGGLALLSISIVIFLSTVLGFEPNMALVALGFGGSLISVFARLGGGIYTKGADVGTDIVGKIEKGIPEDDPRNPGVVADLVGDNVGDDAGMAADLFETYVVTAVSAILLGSLLFGGGANVLFPLLVSAISLIACLVGTFFVRLSNSKRIMPALYKGVGATAIFATIGVVLALRILPPNIPQLSDSSILGIFLVGVAITTGMIVTTEFFTGKNSGPVRKVAEAGASGHATNIIAGLALSMKATLFPILLIAVGILASYILGGLFGIALGAVSMLSLTAIVVAIDAFGPITDNAGGIAEMSGQSESVRKVTDSLDAVGNTTKAVTKAYAIASAGLASLVLFAAYTEELARRGMTESFSLSDPYVLVGLFLGASLPYLFAGFAMEAVGRASQAIVAEIRRQFKEIKGILAGTARPEYAKCVDIVTKAALREMIIPALIPVITPIAVGLLLGSRALGGLLMGIIITGLFVAISMTTGGAAWDNAKKYIEDGNLGGKGSVAHQSAVTGDTVGDPYKDTAGPAINPMIKVANVVALLLAPFLV
ncbi:MAG: sodium-translocating pyrophosphatase [Candidatus Blackburnbacteria bacterium]|nr:sodium-translocating pyrophosphatase [Candidatus Blackburnbacteria bacterium]